MELNNKELIKAISKQIAEQSTEVQQTREREFKIWFKIKGEAIVRKGNDFEQIQHFSIDWQKAFMYAVNKLNKDTAFTVLREFLNSPEIEITNELKQRVAEITNEIKGTAKKATAGKITIKGEFLHSQEIEICENC